MPSWCLLCLLLLFAPAAGQPQFDVEYVEAIKPLHYVAYRTSGAIASQRCRTWCLLLPCHAPQVPLHFDARRLQNKHIQASIS